MRLIDADDLINTLGISNNDIYCEETIEEYILDNGILSFAEPERKKGKWLANSDIPKDCPFCGEDWDKYVFGDVWYTGELPKFCPNCGADMREDT